MTFNYVSLFSGIGGFDLALNRLGGKCVMASEIDKFASQAYEILYGEKPKGDVTKIHETDVPDHDLLVAGFPCQTFSVAGHRKGFEDTRGTLFFEVARIAKEKQPKAILLENVKGLVGHDKGKTLDTIVQTLSDIGYTIDFDVLNSKYFGVPQNRERIFIVAIRDDIVKAEPWKIEGNTVVPKGKKRIAAMEGVKTFNFDYPENNEVTMRLRDVLESEVDGKYYLSEDKTTKLVKQLEDNDKLNDNQIIDNSQLKREGIPRTYETIAPTINARDYKDPRMVGHADMKGNEVSKRVYDEKGISPCVNARSESAKILTAGHCDFKGNRQTREVVYTEGMCPALTTMQGGHREPKIVEPKVTKIAGMYGMNKQAGSVYDREGLSPTIDTPSGGHSEPKIIEPSYRIRKLIPLECWRLQAFPDEFHEKLVSANISDSQRYKMAGNAVTVSVIDAIGRRLLPYITENNEGGE